MINLLKKQDFLSIKVLLKEKNNIFNNFGNKLEDKVIRDLLKKEKCIGYFEEKDSECLMILDNNVIFYLDDFNIYDKFFKYLIWNYGNKELNIKVDKKDKLKYLIEKYKFTFVKSEDSNLIFSRKKTEKTKLFLKD